MMTTPLDYRPRATPHPHKSVWTFAGVALGSLSIVAVATTLTLVALSILEFIKSGAQPHAPGLPPLSQEDYFLRLALLSNVLCFVFALLGLIASRILQGWADIFSKIASITGLIFSALYFSAIYIFH